MLLRRRRRFRRRRSGVLLWSFGRLNSLRLHSWLRRCPVRWGLSSLWLGRFRVTVRLIHCRTIGRLCRSRLSRLRSRCTIRLSRSGRTRPFGRRRLPARSIRRLIRRWSARGLTRPPSRRLASRQVCRMSHVRCRRFPGRRHFHRGSSRRRSGRPQRLNFASR